MLRTVTILMALLQTQVWGIQPLCNSSDCEPEPVKSCCSMPIEEEPLTTGCGSDGHVCPCCVTGEMPAEGTSEQVKELWNGTILHLTPIPAKSLMPAQSILDDGETRIFEEGHFLPNAPPRAFLSSWNL